MAYADDVGGYYQEQRKMLFMNRIDFNIPIPIHLFNPNSSDTTPNVSNIGVITCNNNGTIVNFINASDNQLLRILGDGLTTIQFNSNIKTNTGVDKLLLTSIVYTFHYINSIWYESE